MHRHDEMVRRLDDFDREQLRGHAVSVHLTLSGTADEIAGTLP